jgi:hypothetical protein
MFTGLLVLCDSTALGEFAKIEKAYQSATARAVTCAFVEV